MKILRHLCRHLRGLTVWLYVDRARWHKGEPIDRFLQKHPCLHLDYLPCYQPGLNVQERLWKQIRYEATTNRWFENLEAIWLAILRALRSWSPKKIRRLCNIS
jgi:transposase